MVAAIIAGRKTQKKLYVKRGESPTSVEHIAVGPRLIGEKNPASKLTDAQRSEIRCADGVTQAELARRFGVSQSCISAVRGGRHA